MGGLKGQNGRNGRFVMPGGPGVSGSGYGA